MEALRQIAIPNLRWPGGCFADEYHWKDGIGPKAGRPSMINSHWGEVEENNHFGTHEFMHLCELLGAEPYITANVGSGSVEEMSQWLEYLTRASDSPMAQTSPHNGREEPWGIKFWGLGNENWACGGNMRPEYYADLARRYGTYSRHHGGEQLYRIAVRSWGRRLRLDRDADEDQRRSRLRMPPPEPFPGDLLAPLQLRPAAGMGLHRPPWCEGQRNPVQP